MPRGVFNPFQAPKKKFKPAIEKVDTEPHPDDSNIRLDGDSYIIELKNVEVEQVAEKLGNLIRDVASEYRDLLREEGVELLPVDQKMDKEGYAVLPAPAGNLYVYVGNDGTEIDAFRRIGHALYLLPVGDLLKTHAMRIIARG